MKENNFSVRKKDYYLNSSDGVMNCDSCLKSGIKMTSHHIKVICIFYYYEEGDKKMNIPLKTLFETFQISVEYLVNSQDIKLNTLKPLFSELEQMRIP